MVTITLRITCVVLALVYMAGSLYLGRKGRHEEGFALAAASLLMWAAAVLVAPAP